jgi:hypothetical protein
MSFVKRYGRGVALTGAVTGALLVLGGCSKQEEQAPAAPSPAAPQAEPSAQAPAEAPRPPVGLEQPSKVEYVMPREPVTAKEPPGPPPKDFKLGQSREDVMRLLGDCAERMHYLPGGPGSLSVEIVQPKEGDCRKRLGERHLFITGGLLQEIRPGALTPPPPAPKPPPEDV